jgi:hypothetical protein
MDEDDSPSPETHKLGIRASTASAPVPRDEPSFSVRTDTGSQPGPAPQTGLPERRKDEQTTEPEDSKTDECLVVGTRQEETEVIELLRTPKLSIKNLDEPTKEKVRRVMLRLHRERGISLTDIAKMIGNKTSGYTSWLFKQLGLEPRAFEEARLKGIKEKRRKYERKPFDGTDEDKAYLLGIRHGDL